MGQACCNIAGELRRYSNYLVTNKLKNPNQRQNVYAVEFNLVCTERTFAQKKSTADYVIAALNA